MFTTTTIDLFMFTIITITLFMYTNYLFQQMYTIDISVNNFRFFILSFTPEKILKFELKRRQI